MAYRKGKGQGQRYRRSGRVYKEFAIEHYGVYGMALQKKKHDIPQDTSSCSVGSKIQPCQFVA